ncbi:NAD(FAD)-dependent dehydrogenase [Pseudomonas fluorescens HK44]|jgi:predicted molibdopterin-dependent oxidoreductase YjgC|uniref:NAD(FAD)-dependent dehydrogenase n=1 Tax=Pseudomonas fluorescens HK44 TaxID=1042209 RepID=A0A010TFI5_PSEFL|nr:(2Fe-2S)-binding protein [Pseudomonas fluorescens]EXF95907.1 NAD(FAD)-dependent dehydrogenase [Pseudomonas fluorescens HK44]
MPTEPLFQPVTSESRPTRTLNLTFNGKTLTVPAGISVAAALLMVGVTRFRATPVSEAPRAPYCMMGVCFECLVDIDGVPNRQSCLVEVSEGMKIRSQEGARDLIFQPVTNQALEVQP